MDVLERYLGAPRYVRETRGTTATASAAMSAHAALYTPFTAPATAPRRGAPYHTAQRTTPSSSKDTGSNARRKTKDSSSSNNNLIDDDDAARARHESRLRAIRKNNSERARRYRKRKKEQAGHTVGQVEALRDEIATLYQRKQLHEERLLAAPFTASNIAVKNVHEYFSVFRFGMATASPRGHHRPHHAWQAAVANQSPVSSNQALVAAEPSRQELFLSSMAHPQVVFGDFVGVHPLLDQWRRYSSVHASVRLEFVSFRMTSIEDCPVVSTTGVLHLRYSRKTIARLFPHALAHEALVQRLVGKEVHLGYADTFYFDRDGRMVRYELVPGLVQALYEAVGNLQDVALLLGDARIEHDAVISRDVARDDTDEDDENDERDVIASDGASEDSDAGGVSPIMDIQFILS